MDILDKIFRECISPLSMRNRIWVAKKYNSWRKGRFLRYRAEVLAAQFPEMKKSQKLEDGWMLDSSMSLPFLSEAVLECAEILETANPVIDKKDYLKNFLSIDELENSNFLIPFATSYELVQIVASYLGFIPVLSSIEIWVSSPGDSESSEIKGSQLFHLDNADTNQVKVFVNIDDVDKSSGPLYFYGIESSGLIKNKTKYGSVRNVHRLSDEDAYKAAMVSPISNIGPKGTVALLDTSQCFHYGSRYQSTTRKILMLQYVSPCRADFRPRVLDRYKHESPSLIENLLLKPDFTAEKL